MVLTCFFTAAECQEEKSGRSHGRAGNKTEKFRTHYSKITNTALKSLSWHRFHYKAQLSRPCQCELLLEESQWYSPIGGKLGDRTGARTEFTDGYRGKVVVYHLDTNDMTLYHNQDHGR